MRIAALLAVVCVGVAPAAAEAETRAHVVARPASAGPTAPFLLGPVQARVGETIELAVVLVDQGRVLSDVPRVRLGRGPARLPDGPLPAGTEIGWIRIEPRMQHVTFPPPNPHIPQFSNAVLTGPRHGRWLGYDRLEYDAHPVVPDQIGRASW